MLVTGKTSQDQKLRIFSPAPTSLEKGEELEMELKIMLMGKLHETPIAQVVETFLVGKQVEALGRVANPEGTEALCPLVPHTLPYTPFPSLWSSVSLIMTFYNKLVNSK